MTRCGKDVDCLIRGSSVIGRRLLLEGWIAGIPIQTTIAGFALEV